MEMIFFGILAMLAVAFWKMSKRRRSRQLRPLDLHALAVDKLFARAGSDESARLRSLKVRRIN